MSALVRQAGCSQPPPQGNGQSRGKFNQCGCSHASVLSIQAWLGLVPVKAIKPANVGQSEAPAAVILPPSCLIYTVPLHQRKL